jgi:hypothetical protein
MRGNLLDIDIGTSDAKGFVVDVAGDDIRHVK